MANRGSVFRRPNSPNWHARIIIEGKPRTKGGFTTKARAQSWIDKIYQDHERAQVLGIRAVKDDLLFEEFLPKWKNVIRSRTKQKTYDGYVLGADRILLPHFKGKVISKITRTDVEEFLAKRSTKGVKGATLNRNLTVLSSILSTAVDLGFARENVTRGVKRGRERLRDTRYLSVENEARLFAALPAWLKTPALVALDGGLRAGEIAHLTRRDIDLHRATLIVRESKNHEPRELGLTRRLRKALREHLKALEKGQDTLFLLPDGKAFDEYGYQRDFKAAAERAGIAPFTLHDLRHAAGVRLAEAGATPAEISAFLGHKTLAMTMRYIRHAPRDAARSAARLLDRMQEQRQKGTGEGAV
ncbi:MAG: tyrosine-type recombinase/integrase [Planctomycetota bacterium]